ncbi:MAG: hypothetical protein RLQ12_16790 [Cyclobacteriaceae bacterium]
MIFQELLDRYYPKAQKAVLELFQAADANQVNENDIFLIIQNGHFEPVIARSRKLNGLDLSPYVFGSGSVGIKEGSTLSIWFEHYITENIIQGKREDYYRWLKSKKDWDKEYNVKMQYDLLFYLRFWESEFVLKLFRELTLLAVGQPYNWHLTIKGYQRSEFIKKKILNKLKNVSPGFYRYINTIYYPELRNAIAHTLFFNLGETFTFDTFEKTHPRRSMKSVELDIITNKVFALYMALNKINYDLNKEYLKAYKEKHFGINVQVPRSWDRNQLRTEWIKVYNKRWIWYQTWAKHYRKNFSIS